MQAVPSHGKYSYKPVEPCQARHCHNMMLRPLLRHSRLHAYGSPHLASRARACTLAELKSSLESSMKTREAAALSQRNRGTHDHLIVTPPLLLRLNHDHYHDGTSRQPFTIYIATCRTVEVSAQKKVLQFLPRPRPPEKLWSPSRGYLPSLQPCLTGLTLAV